MKRFRAWKRILVLLILAAVFASVPQIPAYANKYLESDKVQLFDPQTNRIGEYTPVNIMVRGRDLLSDAPGIMIKGRTLIPVADIFRNFDIPYEYLRETRQVKFTTPAGKQVTLNLGDPYALVDGVRTLLPDGVAARVLAYRTTSAGNESDEFVWRTYVPVRFVVDLLDLDVAWIGSTRTVAINQKRQDVHGIKINYKAHFPEIRIEMSDRVDFVAYDIDGSSVGAKDQIILDLQNTELKIQGTNNGTYVERIPDEIFGISQFRLEQISTNPFMTRLTIDQNERKGYEVTYEEATKEVVVRLMGSVLGTRVQKLYGADTVVVDATVNPMINVRERNNLLIVDFLDSNLKMEAETQEVNQGKIKYITTKALTPSEIAQDYPTNVYGFQRVVRMIIEATEPIQKKDYFFEQIDNRAFVYFSEEQLNNIAYSKHSREGATLTIGTKLPVSPSAHYDAENREVSFLLTEQDAHLAAFENAVGDNILTSFAVRKTEGGYRVSAVLADKTSYRLTHRPGGVALEFTNEQIKDSIYKDKIIVVDAGHGGYDPGAVGSKISEKVLALRASLYLEEKLNELGFRVFMTRKDDTYVGLFERGTMAENIKADLFVSVHINAHVKKNVSGIETLYGTEIDKILARMIQNRLMETFPNARNRGVVEFADLVVLRTTSMPSVLVELGFISNEEEQERMMEDSYMRKSAQAIADGIVEFVEKHLIP
ncbi:MAG: N-acetylmuramoyl-L-alanine amidase [Bacillota bacterium]|nr:N-acetylmuramoyl-L-alanine amidase [Bacillota bacterium]